MITKKPRRYTIWFDNERFEFRAVRYNYAYWELDVKELQFLQIADAEALCDKLNNFIKSSLFV